MHGSHVSFETASLHDVSCPSCGHVGIEQFYRVDGIPVHSCLLMDTPREAVQFRRGDLLLAFCHACGFITNTRYDPSTHEYSMRYEETQGFSPTFSKFTKTLVDQLIERYDLRGKTVMEIGCGKGEFLSLLCREGGNHGIGIDPSYAPGRLPEDDAARLTFHQEFFSDKFAREDVDFVCCRHSLEHMPNPQAFVELLRTAIGDRRQIPVFFDLPDVKRVLEEGAFWDLYYEHCSYFGAGSLARLFRSTRFEIAELNREYDDQYLMLYGVPSSRNTRAHFPIEEDLETLRMQVASFRDRCGRLMLHWREMIDRVTSHGGRLIVWGSGSKGVAFLTTLGLTDEIDCVVDINPHKQGKFMPGTGHEIVGPTALVDRRPTHVIVMNPVYCEEISRDLERLNIRTELIPIWEPTISGAA